MHAHLVGVAGIRFDVKDYTLSQSCANDTQPNNAKANIGRRKNFVTSRHATETTTQIKAPIVQDDLKKLIMPTLKVPPRGSFVRASAYDSVDASPSKWQNKSSPQHPLVHKQINHADSMYGDDLNSDRISIDDMRPSSVGGVLRPGKVDPSSSSGKRRPNSGSSVRRHPPPGRWQRQGPSPPPWTNSSVCGDRDLLTMQQDLEILKHRNKHRPDSLLRNPESAAVPNPSLTSATQRHSLKGRIHIDAKKRCLHRSFQAVANDELPFHPALKELQDHGIHDSRWCVGYDRLGEETDLHKYAKPAEKPHKKGHDAFWRDFHHSQYEEDAEDDVEMFRHVESFASSYTRLGRK